MFDELSAEEKVSYLEDCLPEQPYNNVMSEYGHDYERAVDTLLSRGKEIIVSQMQDGVDTWQYLVDKKDISEKQFIDESSYRELAYYHSAMEDAGLKTYLFRFHMEDDSGLPYLIEQGYGQERLRKYITNGNESEVESSFSSVGLDIWGHLNNQLTPRMAYFEDDSHLYIEFWIKTDSREEFHV